MQLSVVVPVKNEEENVLPLIAEIQAALAGYEYEILYVDDGSSDGTLSILQSLKEKIPVLRIIRHTFSCGQSTAVLSGVLKARYNLVVTLDGDGQNDPADIPRLMQCYQAEIQKTPELACVAGWRISRQDDGLKRISSRVANTVRSRLLKDETPDTGCGIKLFRRDIFLRLPYFDHMHRFLPALFMRAGNKLISLPVNHRPRKCGVSKYGLHNRLWVGLIDILGVMWLLCRAQIPEYSEE